MLLKISYLDNKQKKYFEKALQHVSKILKQCLPKEDFEYYLSNPQNSIKVRPDYGYTKFYLDWVDTSYDMSLQALIHFILFEDRYYKKLLSKETYKSLSLAYKRNSEIIIYSYLSESERELINYIECLVINFMRWRVKLGGLDDSLYTKANYNLEPILQEISQGTVFENIIVDRQFIFDLDSYNTSLTDTELDIILLVSDNIMDIDDLITLSKIMFVKDKIISEKIVHIAITKVEKRSESLKLVNYVKNTNYFDNETWSNYILENG